MRILLVSSECTPYAKSGGLGDVVGALGAALAARGHRVLTVTPAYAHRAHSRQGAHRVDTPCAVDIAGTTHRLDVDVLERDGVVHAFVHHPVFDRFGLYGDDHGAFGDNHFRFLLLCHAALQAAMHVPLAPGEVLGDQIVVSAHDWQGALAPVLLDAVYRPFGFFGRAGSVLTIHNLAHQGRFGGHAFADLGLPDEWFTPSTLEWFGDVNLLKGGILAADVITTVSPGYAQEIVTSAGGHGLHEVLAHRREHLVGILNGIDTDEWNPATDPYIEATYGPEDLTGKAVCKGALQAELALPVDARCPLVGFVGRLDPQKGIDIITQSVPWLVEEQRAQVVVLGSADPAHAHYEDRLRELEARFPRKMRAWIGYSEAMAHRIEAGADLFMMPSRFEPCGLNQLYSMRYGTPPVVHATGGLRDTVSPVDRTGAHGTGWPFTPFDGYAFRTALWSGLDCWRNRPQAFRAVQRRGMALPLGWDTRVPEYEAVFERALARRR